MNDNKTEKLKKADYAILEKLKESRGKIVTHGTLIQMLTDRKAELFINAAPSGGEHTSSIRRLRKIGKFQIENIPGIGYRLIK